MGVAVNLTMIGAAMVGFPFWRSSDVPYNGPAAHGADDGHRLAQLCRTFNLPFRAQHVSPSIERKKMAMLNPGRLPLVCAALVAAWLSQPRFARAAVYFSDD